MFTGAEIADHISKQYGCGCGMFILGLVGVLLILRWFGV